MSCEHHDGGRGSASGRRLVSQLSTVAAWTRAALAAIVLLSSAAPVDAEPLKDAAAAYFRGDYTTAVRLVRPLADQGYAPAQTRLGFAYQKGEGVPQNPVEAVKWYRLAADQGDIDAQNNLGTLYFDGDGVTQDFVRAHVWFNLSAARGNQDAVRNRDRASKVMTPTQIAEAQKLASEWKAKRP